MMTIAKRSPIPGALYIAKNAPASPAEIADLAGTSNVELVQKAISTFHALDMIDFDGAGAAWLVHWEERQFESDTSTQRVRRFRSRQKPPAPPPGNDAPPDKGNVSGNNNETFHRNGSETDQSRVEQSRTDTEQSRAENETLAALPGYQETFKGKPGLALYFEITGQYPPVVEWERIESNFEQGQARNHLPRDKFKEYAARIFKTWCATRTSDGKPYNPSNPGWTDWLPNGYGSAGPAPEANRNTLTPEQLAKAGQRELERRRAARKGGGP